MARRLDNAAPKLSKTELSKTGKTGKNRREKPGQPDLFPFQKRETEAERSVPVFQSSSCS
jgi:hypothetical protein